jgi:flagellar M-ring protein FliF
MAAQAFSLPKQWRLIALVFAALLAALVAWYMLALHDDFVPLYRNLSPSDLSAVSASLDRENIRYRSDDQGNVLVLASQADDARRKLAAAHAGPTAIEGFELFDASDMGLTDFAQKIKYQRALQGELERTIMMIDGVRAARVHISTPDHQLFDQSEETAKAAVTLATRGPEDETPDRIAGIQRLVAAAVPELSVSDVVVLDERGEILSSGVELLTAHPGAQAQAALPPQLSGGGKNEFIELITMVVGRAIPDKRFSVSLDAASNTSSGAGPGLVATVTTDAALSPEEVDGVRDALTEAGAVSGSPIATIVFDSDNRVAPAPAPPRLSARTPSDLAPVLEWGGAAGAIAATLAIVLWMRRRKREAPALSEADHIGFAEQLRQALATHGGEGGAA